MAAKESMPGAIRDLATGKALGKGISHGLLGVGEGCEWNAAASALAAA